MNIVPMSHFKYLIVLGCVSLLMACGQKGPLVVKDTSLEIDRTYINKVKSDSVTAQLSIAPSAKAAKQRDPELQREGYHP